MVAIDGADRGAIEPFACRRGGLRGEWIAAGDTALFKFFWLTVVAGEVREDALDQPVMGSAEDVDASALVAALLQNVERHMLLSVSGKCACEASLCTCE